MPDTNPPDRDSYFNVPGVASVRWDPSLRMVHEVWEGWADSNEFTTMLSAGIKCLGDHSSTRWLADCRRQRVMKAEDQEWADTVWLPNAVAAGLKRFAIVLPQSVLATMNLQVREQKWRAAGLDLGYFDTVEQAQEWLAR